MLLSKNLQKLVSSGNVTAKNKIIVLDSGHGGDDRAGALRGVSGQTATVGTRTARPVPVAAAAVALPPPAFGGHLPREGGKRRALQRVVFFQR